jgi:hypothetical protein
VRYTRGARAREEQPRVALSIVAHRRTGDTVEAWGKAGKSLVMKQLHLLRSSGQRYQRAFILLVARKNALR